jgi:hypothetical protein
MFWFGGNLCFPETGVLCVCKNLSFLVLDKIRFRFSTPLLKMGWVSHWQISCENNPVLEPLRSRCPNKQLPSICLPLPQDCCLQVLGHVLWISHTDAHDWGQMFSILHFAHWDSLYFSMGCTVTNTGTPEQL